MFKITVESKKQTKIFNAKSFFLSLKEEDSDTCEVLYQCQDHEIFNFTETLIYIQHSIAEKACCKQKQENILRCLVELAEDDLRRKKYILHKFLENERTDENVQ